MDISLAVAAVSAVVDAAIKGIAAFQAAHAQTDESAAAFVVAEKARLTAALDGRVVEASVYRPIPATPETPGLPA